MCPLSIPFFFFFNDTATTEIYTLSLHDALPILGHYRDRLRVALLLSLTTARSGGRAASGKSRGGAASVVACAIESPFSVQDRKSTRLNSSHQIISYAVFCLKKKKTTYCNDPV